jgi:hypothetical protein
MLARRQAAMTDRRARTAALILELVSAIVASKKEVGPTQSAASRNAVVSRRTDQTLATMA